jgi:hypothetical protein
LALAIALDWDVDIAALYHTVVYGAVVLLASALAIRAVEWRRWRSAEEAARDERALLDGSPVGSDGLGSDEQALIEVIMPSIRDDDGGGGGDPQWRDTAMTSAAMTSGATSATVRSRGMESLATADGITPLAMHIAVGPAGHGAMPLTPLTPLSPSRAAPYHGSRGGRRSFNSSTVSAPAEPRTAPQMPEQQ